MTVHNRLSIIRTCGLLAIILTLAGCGNNTTRKTDAQDRAARVAAIKRGEAFSRRFQLAREKVIWARAEVRTARYCVRITGGEAATEAEINGAIKGTETMIRLYRKDPKAPAGNDHETRRQALSDQASRFDEGCDAGEARRLDRVLRNG